MKKRKNSDLAQKLTDSLLDDVEGLEVSYGAAPSESVSIAGLAPIELKEEQEYKKAVVNAIGFLPSEADGGQEEGGEKEAPRNPEDTAAKLWTEVAGGVDQPAKKVLSSKKKKNPRNSDEKTMAIEAAPEGISDLEEALSSKSKQGKETDFDPSQETVVAGSAPDRNREEPSTKVRFGAPRSTSLPKSEARVYANPDASLVQAESLKLAQERILQLETEVENLRRDNEELASAGETLRERADELLSQVEKLERSKKNQKEDLENELVLLKDRLSHKDSELTTLKQKRAELENRLQRDFKKVRVRERELENRLELARMENAALIRSKDETILDLKRRIDQLESEAEAYRQKCQELNHQIDSNQEQFRRTVKALRLALTNLEVDDESLAPFRKAE